MTPITARVVETPRPKRPTLYLALGRDAESAEWCCGNPGDTPDEAAKNLFVIEEVELEYQVLIPGTDEELTRERVEAAIKEITAEVADKTDPYCCPLEAENAMRELVRRLGIIESEGT